MNYLYVKWLDNERGTLFETRRQLFWKNWFGVKSYFLYTELDCHNDWIKVLPFLEYFIVAPRTSFDSNTYSTFATNHNARDFLSSWIITTPLSFILHSWSFTLQSGFLYVLLNIFRTPSISKMFRKVEKMLTTFVKIYRISLDINCETVSLIINIGTALAAKNLFNTRTHDGEEQSRTKSRYIHLVEALYCCTSNFLTREHMMARNNQELNLGIYI